MTVEIFTDGACRGNPGPGGWGALLRYNDHEKTLKGAEPLTTNNRMELMAVIMGLHALKQASTVNIYTDSKYVLQGMTEWIIGWKKRNWRNSKNEPVKNVDLWKILDSSVALHQVKWFWVKGHSGHVENERADALANEAIDEFLQRIT